MDKKLFSDLVTSLKQAGQIAQAIRARTKLSQAEFALLMGVSVKTLQNWEQARRRPRGPAAALLRIVEREPEMAVRALHS